MGKLVVYGALGSPPVRAVLMALKELGLEYDFKTIDVHAGETRTKEFLKMNPQHTIPVLADDGQYIWDSHAILGYLARKYGKTDSLYPKDYYQRAVVDQRLHFETSVLFKALVDIFRAVNTSREEKLAGIEETYNLLEVFLQNSYLAGDHLTIADMSNATTVSALDLVIPVADGGKWPKLAAWFQKMKRLPYYDEVNAEGTKGMAEMLKPLI